MPKRSWRYFLAIGLAVLFAFGVSATIFLDAWKSQSFYEQQAEEAAKSGRDASSIYAQRACGTVPLTERAECLADEHHEARERERQEYDLQAQLVMATWTRAMGLAALIAMMTGIIGVGLIYATYAETRESNLISRRAAEAARREADESREALILAERAIVRLKSAHFLIGEQVATRWKVVFRLLNEGRSNAHKFRIDYRINAEPNFSKRLTQTRNFERLCRADGGETALEFWIRPRSRFPAYLMGEVTYHTLHNSIFRTYFCCEITGPPGQQSESGAYVNRLHLVRCEGLPQDT